MGAALGEEVRFQEKSVLTLLEIEKLSKGGIDLDSLDQLKILPDGTLAYKDSRILLYIRDLSHYNKYDEVSMPKFHVSNCSTLERMRSNNRFDRYVVATREDGLFELNVLRSNGYKVPRTERLNICQPCLKRIRWPGFSGWLPQEEKWRIISEFSIADFFKKYERSLHTSRPRYTSDNAPLNQYTRDFPEISAALKRLREYRCEECRADLSRQDHQKYLHVHHRNGLKHDNNSNNLKVVCFGCHANEPDHGHMKRGHDYEEFLKIRPYLI
jgi:hypothetical protein